MITMNWIPIGLNWTILFKCLEMTIVVIWRYVNKLNWIELNWTHWIGMCIPICYVFPGVHTPQNNSSPGLAETVTKNLPAPLVYKGNNEEHVFTDLWVFLDSITTWVYYNQYVVLNAQEQSEETVNTHVTLFLTSKISFSIIFTWLCC